MRADALVGQPGHGLEIAMKAMQVVRTMSTGCSLACADTGLRLAWDFARERRVGGRGADGLPYPRRELATAAALVLAADVAALTAARGAHALPQAQSLWSSVAKKTATDFADEALARCADVLGTRSLLRDGPYAAFDTVRRDNAVVRYIDTSPVANTRLVAAQLARLAGAAAARTTGTGRRTRWAGSSTWGPRFPRRTGTGCGCRAGAGIRCCPGCRRWRRRCGTR